MSKPKQPLDDNGWFPMLVFLVLMSFAIWMIMRSAH